MGVVPSVDTLRKQNQENVDFFKQITDSINASIQQDINTFNGEIDDYYKKNNDQYVVLMTGSSLNYRQQTSFSLDQITKMVNDTANGLFDNQPMPAGTEKKTEPGVLDAISSIAPYKELAIKTALSLLTNILGLFANSTSTTYEKTRDHKIIGPGLMMHLYSGNQIFKSETAFNKESIFTSGLSYTIAFSKTQFVSLAIMDHLIQMKKQADQDVTDNQSVRDQLHANWLQALSAGNTVEAKNFSDAMKAMSDNVNDLYEQIREEGTKETMKRMAA